MESVIEYINNARWTVRLTNNSLLYGKENILTYLGRSAPNN